MSNPLKRLEDKNVAILGFGVEGVSVLKFLRKHLGNIHLTILDKKTIEDLSPCTITHMKSLGNVDLVLGDQYLDTLSQHDVLIKSPGIPNKMLIGKYDKKTTLLTSATEIFLQSVIGTVVGVTGTKGKSTTSALIYHVLERNNKDVYLVGNIGNPSLDLLNDNPKSIYIHEMSSGQLEGLDISPQIAVFLNIFKEHMDHHGSIRNYLSSKSNITMHQNSHDLFIYNTRFEELARIANKTMAKCIAYDPKDFDLPLDTTEIPLVGKHNINNIVAMMIVCREFGLSDEEIVGSLKSFKGLPHRLEVVTEKNRVTYVNDSISTIPESTICAMEAFSDRPLTLILGGMDRDQYFNDLVEYINTSSNVNNIIVVGELSGKLETLLKSKGIDNVINMSKDNMASIVQKAVEVTKSGVILLSPAAASYDQYDNFEDRGNQFKEAVKTFEQ